jgi:hypothetical protein
MRVEVMDARRLISAPSGIENVFRMDRDESAEVANMAYRGGRST